MKCFILTLLLCGGAVCGFTPANASTLDQLIVNSGTNWTPVYPNGEGSPAYPFPLSNNLPVQDYTAVELTDPTTGAPSDYVWYVHFATLYFASDSNGSFTGLPTLNIVATLTETGGFQDIGQYFGVAASDIQVLSFADVSTTPLPATLPLFATGLGAMGLLGWRRKRKAAALAAV